MPTVAIECPRCHKGFRLQTANPAAMASKIFRCPKCGMQVPFGQILPGMQGVGQTFSPPPALKTNIAQPQVTVPLNSGGKTHVASNRDVAQLIIENTGRSFSIAQGSYTLGRASSDSSATLKLAPDPYMSRLHARLDVLGTPNGCICILTALSSANYVFVNNTKLLSGQVVKLKNNDRILLGMTNVIFRTN